jgi:hypothetical protein
MYKKIRQTPLFLYVQKTENRSMNSLKMKNERERVRYRNKMKEVISILLESSYYLTIPLEERYSLIRMIIEKHQFLAKKDIEQ